MKNRLTTLTITAALATAGMFGVAACSDSGAPTTPPRHRALMVVKTQGTPQKAKRSLRILKRA